MGSRALTVPLLVALAGCGGRGTPSTPTAAATPTPAPTPSPPDVLLQCATAAITIDTERTTTSCVVSSRNGFSGSVALRCSGQPAAVPCQFDPATLSLPLEASLSSNMVIDVPLRGEAGSFGLQAVATAGALTRTFSIQLTVRSTCTGFREQASYGGDCRQRPANSICWGFSDGYIWLVENEGFGRAGYGYSCSGQGVFAAIGGRASYHHVLGTQLVKTGAP